ncbi:MAG: endoglucanase [archaeon]|nr:endoglucanase [archaeon]
MSRDKQRLLQIMDSLEADYLSGKISEDKYRYFRSKYMAKLNNIENANRPLKTDIPRSIRKNPLKPKNEEEKLIEKYILNPKKQNKPLKIKSKPKTSSKPMDSSTFKLALVLILVVGFTVGISMGVFGFDFGELGNFGGLGVDAVVTDTVFPNVPILVDTNYTDSGNYTSYTNSSSGGVTPEPTPTPTPVNSTY